MPKRKNTKQSKSNKRQSTGKRRNLKHGLKVSLQILSLCILISIAAVIFYFYQTYGKLILELQSEAKQKVSTSTLDSFRSAQTSLVYDVQGNLISSLKAEKDVYYIEYDQIPQVIIDAMIVSEDRNFLEHNGVDYWANIRAAIALIKHRGEITQGASTITQQLARNVFLTHKVTYERKIEEIFIAQELEKKYTKFEILEFYLNEIYFANGHYGIQAAAQGYFGEGITALSLSQMAFLCAIPNSPNRYNPVTNMENTLERRDRILRQLFETGKIDTAEYQAALKEKIKLIENSQDKKNYVETYVYASAIKALMKNQGFQFRYQFDNEEDREAYNKAYDELYYSCQKDLYVKGYRIYTSIDLEKQQLLQASVDEALADFTERNEEGVYKMQGAAVCIDNDTGKVVAVVGGREQELGGYTLNRAYQSFRQPGSAIKPLVVYTPAFERNYTPESIVVDEKFEDGPRNASNSYSGKMKLQQAIEVSKNTIAWKLFEELTPAVGLSYLLKMNFAKITESDYVPAASLGGLTIGVSPVEMAAAYAAIENDGYYREPTCIVMIANAEGEEIVGDSLADKQIYQTKAARIMTEALTGVMKKGTGKSLKLTNTISAGKTGTTNDKRDGWFVGYTPYYTTSVWVGYDIPKTVSNLKGATYPGAIWHNFMEQLHTPYMTEQFELYDWRAELEKAQQELDQKDTDLENSTNQESVIDENLSEDMEEDQLEEDWLEEDQIDQEDLAGDNLDSEPGTSEEVEPEGDDTEADDTEQNTGSEDGTGENDMYEEDIYEDIYEDDIYEDDIYEEEIVEEGAEEDTEEGTSESTEVDSEQDAVEDGVINDNTDGIE